MPQPTSATRTPAVSRSVSPGTSGSQVSTSNSSSGRRLSWSMTVVNSGANLL